MVKSSSLNKFEVWREIKRHILAKMDKDRVSPEKADDILGFVRRTLPMVQTMEDLGQYLGMLNEKFEDLTPVVDEFRLHEKEKMDMSISRVFEFLMDRGEFELVETLMAKIEKMNDVYEKMEEVKRFCPKEFEKAYKEIFSI